MAAPVSICSGFEYSTSPEYRRYAVIASTWTSFTKCVEEPLFVVDIAELFVVSECMQELAGLSSEVRELALTCFRLV